MAAQGGGSLWYLQDVSAIHIYTRTHACICVQSWSLYAQCISYALVAAQGRSPLRYLQDVSAIHIYVRIHALIGMHNADFYAQCQRNRLAWPHRRRLALASDGVRYAGGRTEQRRPPVSKRYETKVGMVWGSSLIALAALKTPTSNGYISQGGNLTFLMRSWLVKEEAPFGIFKT